MMELYSDVRQSYFYDNDLMIVLLAAEYPDPCPENEFGIGMREGMGYWNSDQKKWTRHKYLRAHCVDNGYRGYG